MAEKLQKEVKMLLLFSYFALMNLASLSLMYIDKQRAIKQAWRISEKALLGCCLLGGFIGTYFAMKAFRHKTRHWYFYAAVILGATPWLALAYYTKP